MSIADAEPNDDSADNCAIAISIGRSIDARMKRTRLYCYRRLTIRIFRYRLH